MCGSVVWRLLTSEALLPHLTWDTDNASFVLPLATFPGPPAMELRHLRYFVAVGEALSFTKGAEKLHLAQPSLTRQIKDLEEEIQVKLLDRTKQQISLTEEALNVLEIVAWAALSITSARGQSRGSRPT